MSDLEKKIGNLQGKLGLNQNGIINLPTVNALEGIFNIFPLSKSNHKTARQEIQKKIGFSGSEVDGIFGPQTVAALDEIILDSVKDTQPTLSSRIKMIQEKLSVPRSGVYDLLTINALEAFQGIQPLSVSPSKIAKQEIQHHLGFKNDEIDGILGRNSTARIEAMTSFLMSSEVKNSPLNVRIRTIQSKLYFAPTGIFDRQTVQALANKLEISIASGINMIDAIKEIQQKLGFLGKEVDGVLGPKSIAEIEKVVMEHPTNKQLNLPNRIRAIQRQLPFPISGEYDLPTLNALEYLLHISPFSNSPTKEAKRNIQRALGLTGNKADGILGIESTTKIEAFLENILPPLPLGSSLIISQKTIDFIIKKEIGSDTYYQENLRNPIIPAGQSGVTIGIGYDLGYTDKATFRLDWGGLLSAADLNLLTTVVGKKDAAARKALTPEIKSAEIPLSSSKEVFATKSMPVYAALTLNAFPQTELLPPDVQGMVLSLVYNRGAALTGRQDMQNVRRWISEGDLQQLADEIENMKIHWQDKPGLRGLVIRREEEADIIRNADFYFLPKDLIFV